MRRFRRRRTRTVELARMLAALDQMAAEKRPWQRRQTARIALGRST